VIEEAALGDADGGDELVDRSRTDASASTVPQGSESRAKAGKF
jgi:hypothetical protein